MESGKINWGILTTGRIARKFARALARSETGKLHAVAARVGRDAEAFAGEFDAPRWYEGYENLLADPDVRAVYVATPHPMHGEWAIRAAEAGKAVLCEKPLEVNAARVRRVIEAARRNGVFLMEAFMYRCHPQTARLVEILESGEIGEARVIRATFGYRGNHDLTSIKLNRATAGGAIMDVGCYAVSMSRLVAGTALGQPFAEPFEVTGGAFLGPESGVDEYAVGTLRFPGGILAQVATAVRVAMDNRVTVFGSRGSLTVETPWFCSGIEGGTSRILVSRDGDEEPRVEEVSTDKWLYEIEADTVAANIHRTEAPPPAMTWEDSLGNAVALDRWRKAVGLAYEWDV